MKTVNYILRSAPDRTLNSARPHGRSQGRVLPSVGDKVVDLETWKAEHLAEPDEPEIEQTGTSERHEGRRPARRPDRSAADWAELAATLAVTVAFLVLIARVLLF